MVTKALWQLLHHKVVSSTVMYVALSRVCHGAEREADCCRVYSIARH